MDLSCGAMFTLCQNNIGELQLCYYINCYRPFPLFFVTLTRPFLFRGTLIVCDNNVTKVAERFLYLPDKRSVMYIPLTPRWHYSVTVPLHFTKLYLYFFFLLLKFIIFLLIFYMFLVIHLLCFSLENWKSNYGKKQEVKTCYVFF